MSRFARLRTLFATRRRLALAAGAALALLAGGAYGAWYLFSEPETVIVRRRKAPSLTLPRAQELYEAGRYEEAMDFCARGRRHYKEDPAYWNFCGVTLRTIGYLEGSPDEREEELAAFEKALALSPDFGAARLNLANALWELGRTEEALAQYRRVIAHDPDHPDYAGVLARFSEEERLRMLREEAAARKAAAAATPKPPAQPQPQTQPDAEPRPVDMNER
jgi:tetratricopeptide (TPR) repeat protein